MDKPLSERNWQKVGAFFTRMHVDAIWHSQNGLLKKENFNSACQKVAREVLVEALKEGHTGFRFELEKFIRERAAEVSRIIERTWQLGEALRERQPELVLCHGDPNTSNIFVTDHHKLYMLDWDEIMLAPPERDLMFFESAADFWQGYDPTGRYEPDLMALAYYHYEWVVQEIADFGE